MVPLWVGWGEWVLSWEMSPPMCLQAMTAACVGIQWRVDTGLTDSKEQAEKEERPKVRSKWERTLDL